ncbi:2'-5' RNA ligase family protein [Isoptericola sp. BMS4]|uniref:2'-5' RNA ligase family protein n=1 Tax=Isoptericola sp. BMS4 TaxID=2527875 RepID=UPI0014216FF9|nr:2'-5' RNA ligase family protein [Isoptericola sp. BMS4]
MRLFTAVYPSDDAVAHLELALGGVGGRSLGDPGRGLRWVPAAQRHVTLVFHGEVPDGAVPGYVEALEVALRDVPPFELALAGSGAFGGRTLWIGVTGAVPELQRAAATARDVADGAGLPAADRAGGRPHLTVARTTLRAAPDRRGAVAGARGGSRGPRGRSAESPLVPWARALAVYRGPAWRVDTVHVVGSRLGEGRSGGPLHEDVAVVPLGPGPG